MNVETDASLFSYITGNLCLFKNQIMLDFLKILFKILYKLRKECKPVHLKHTLQEPRDSCFGHVSFFEKVQEDTL